MMRKVKKKLNSKFLKVPNRDFSYIPLLHATAKINMQHCKKIGNKNKKDLRRSFFELKDISLDGLAW